MPGRRRRAWDRGVMFGAQEFRDLQMWSQLAWFDEESAGAGPGNSRMDAARPRLHSGRPGPHGRKAARNREPGDSRIPEAGGHRARSKSPPPLITTPFCRWCAIPILPRWRIPACLCRRATGIRRMPAGSSPWRGNIAARISAWRRWGCGPRKARSPTKCSRIAAELGFQWAATDSGVLNRTLSRPVPVDGLYRPYRWHQGGRSLGVIFRDHFLSDLIGFVYSKMDAARGGRRFSAAHSRKLLRHSAFRARCPVPIILDGENAWEYYDHNGRPFLRELYRRISDDSGMRAVTVKRGSRPGRARTAGPYLPRLVDQRQFRCVDRRRGRQPGVDPTAARPPDVRFRGQRQRRTDDAWLSRNC